MFQPIRILIVIVSLCVMPISWLYAQTGSEDSKKEKIDTIALKALVSDANVSSEQKIEPLLILAEELGRTDIRKLSAYSREAYKIAHDSGDSARKGIAARMMGVSYAIQGNYGEAAFLFSQSYNLARKYGQINQETRALLNLGGIYFTQNEWTKSATYLSKALEKASEVSDSLTIAATHEAIGLVFLNTHELDSSEFHFREAINLYNLLGKKREMANAMSSFAEVYQSRKQYPQALVQLQQSESIFQREDGDKMSSQHITAILNRATVRFLMKDFQNAAKNLDYVIESSQKQGLLNHLSQAYRIQSKIDSARQDYVSSLTWMNKYFNVNDSIAALDKKS